jgi:hypothetical protein
LMARSCAGKCVHAFQPEQRRQLSVTEYVIERSRGRRRNPATVEVAGFSSGDFPCVLAGQNVYRKPTL